MAHTKISTAAPFEGVPRINAPAMYGASPNKPILYRIPVTGKRPMAISVENLPDGLNLDDRGILTGKLPEGDYQLTLKAENELGRAEKQICFEIHPDHLLLTPLLGFTTWNAFQSTVRQEDVERSAKYLSETGLSEYGYHYINIDSGWQGAYGGELDAIQPNAKFTNMKAMTDVVHSYGFKCGIYSTPMRHAWGCPAELESIPGCTRGEVDIRLSQEAFGFGVERMEANNAAQWNRWGFDYLKYDWVPNEGFSADLMKQHLLKQDRDFAFCTTVLCKPEYADYWKRNCNSWRNNPDSGPEWNIVKDIFKTYDPWIPHVGKGHFFDMDMLELGESVRNEGVCQLEEDEQIFASTMRAFLMTPIQLSSMLDKLSQFELNLYGNEEILAIHQDPLTSAATLKHEIREGDTWLKIYQRKLADGNVAEAFFNAGDTEQTVVLETGLGAVRDVWAREMLEETSLVLPPHTTRVIKYIR
jgi:alpha-galactosidase